MPRSKKAGKPRSNDQDTRRDGPELDTRDLDEDLHTIPALIRGSAFDSGLNHGCGGGRRVSRYEAKYPEAE